MLLDTAGTPSRCPRVEAVRALLRRLRPQLEELGDWDVVRELAKTMLARGNSADRQRAAYAERGRLDDVVELVVDETQGPPGGPEPAVPALRRYRSGPATRRSAPAYGPARSMRTWSTSSANWATTSCRPGSTLAVSGSTAPGMTFGVER